MTFRMRATDQIIKEIISLDIKEGYSPETNRIWELLEAIPEELHDELAELMVEFSQKFGVLLPFIAQTVKYEVYVTKQQQVLFREDCFAVKCINRILFSDIGRRYLMKLVAPLVTSIFKTPHILDLSKTNVSERPKLEKNITLMIEILDEFLNNFAKSPYFCPITFREIFSVIQKCINERFGKENNSPLVLDFIFFKFICPAIIDPKKYGILEDDKVEMSSPTIRSLINVSKLLNNLAHNVYEKFEDEEYEKVRSFIKVKHPLLQQHLRRLIDPQDIELTKTIIASSVIEPVVNTEEKAEIEIKLRTFLDYHVVKKDSLRRIRTPSQEDQHLEEQKSKKIAELYNLIGNSDWKKLKESRNLTYYICRSQDSSLVKMRFDMKLNIPVEQLFDFCRALENQKYMYSSEDFTSCESLKETENYREIRVTYKLPFPFNPREMAMSMWSDIDENRAVIAIDDLNDRSKCRPLKGHVRALCCLNGWVLKPDILNPGGTSATLIAHYNPQGSIPKWLVNNLSSKQTSIVKTLKQHLETALVK